MFGTVDDQGAVDGLATLAGAAAAWQYGHAFLTRDRQCRGDVTDFFRYDDADWFDLIDRRVGGVAAAIGSVEQHRAADFATQPVGQVRIAWCNRNVVHYACLMACWFRRQVGNMPGWMGHVGAGCCVPRRGPLQSG